MKEKVVSVCLFVDFKDSSKMGELFALISALFVPQGKGANIGHE